MRLYKIKYDGASGTDLWYITEANSKAKAKANFNSDMGVTDKKRSEPMNTTKAFIEGLKKISGKYWRRTK
jgi:hypothetical protein